VKSKHALANILQSASLATMGIVIIVSLHAGVELLFAVVRGMAASLIVRWVLGGAVELIELAGFGRKAPPLAPDAEGEPQRPQGQ